MITQTEVNEWFTYKDGKLYWSKSPSTKMRIGCRAGGLVADGYRHVKLSGKAYKEHRLIFLLFHGYVPPMLDHINRIKDDNHIENLRECTRSQNQVNSKVRGDSASRIRGVSKVRGKWRTTIRFKGKSIHIGYFDGALDAANAYKNKAKELFGEFAT